MRRRTREAFEEEVTRPYVVGLLAGISWWKTQSQRWTAGHEDDDGGSDGGNTVCSGEAGTSMVDSCSR